MRAQEVRDFTSAGLRQALRRQLPSRLQLDAADAEGLRRRQRTPEGQPE